MIEVLDRMTVEEKGGKQRTEQESFFFSVWKARRSATMKERRPYLILHSLLRLRFGSIVYDLVLSLMG